jgi:hypothetical protein
VIQSIIQQNSIGMKAQIFFLAVTIFILSACDPYDTRLTVVNKTTDTIFFVLSEDGNFEKYPIWIDSTNRDTLWTHTDFVKPKDEMSIASMGKNSWEKSIDEHYKDSTLIVFLFEERLLKAVSRDSLLANHLYSKKYAYKVKDLEKLNWRIEYKE